MTNNLQPLYDILKEAFDGGRAYVNGSLEVTAASILFPLAARMEEIVNDIRQSAHELDKQVAREMLIKPPASDYGKGWQAAVEHLLSNLNIISESPFPSSPERET